MAKGFWKRMFYKISDQSLFYFRVQLLANAVLLVLGTGALYILAKFEVHNDAGQMVEEGKTYNEIIRANLFTGVFVMMFTISQFIIGLAAAWKKNPFDLYGYCAMTSMTNFQMLALFFLAVNPLHTKGMRYSKDHDLFFSISIQTQVGIIYMQLFLTSTVLTILLMFPIYDKMMWDQYQLLGLEERLQTAFRDIQMAKANFSNFFLLSLIQLANLIYFETNPTLNLIYWIFSVLFLVSIREGYQALRMEKKTKLDAFLIWATVSYIFIYTIIALRLLSLIDHHRTGPLNKMLGAVLWILLTANLFLMIKYCHRAKKHFFLGITRLQHLLTKGKGLEETLQNN